MCATFLSNLVGGITFHCFKQAIHVRTLLFYESVPECPGELLYKHRITACRVNCENPDPATCSLPDTENCVCADDTHVILLNDTCVHASMCGCYEEGREVGMNQAIVYNKTNIPWRVSLIEYSPFSYSLSDR